jgi:hypothetical protein
MRASAHRKHASSQAPLYCGPKHPKVAERQRIKHLAKLGAAVERALSSTVI